MKTQATDPACTETDVSVAGQNLLVGRQIVGSMLERMIGSEQTLERCKHKSLGLLVISWRVEQVGSWQGIYGSFLMA